MIEFRITHFDKRLCANMKFIYILRRPLKFEKNIQTFFELTKQLQTEFIELKKIGGLFTGLLLSYLKVTK